MTTMFNTDPENRYPSKGPRRVDELAFRVLPHLPGASIDGRETLSRSTGAEKKASLLW